MRLDSNHTDVQTSGGWKAVCLWDVALLAEAMAES